MKYFEEIEKAMAFANKNGSLKATCIRRNAMFGRLESCFIK